MFLLLLLSFLLLVGESDGARVTLLTRGFATWRYTSTLLTNWFSAAHNDGVAPWATGRAPFGNKTSGFNATAIPIGTNSYFRTLVTASSAHSDCRVFIASDSSSTAYLNGVLSDRDSLQVHSATYWNREFLVNFTAGANVLAVELISRAGASKTAFDAEVTCELGTTAPTSATPSTAPPPLTTALPVSQRQLYAAANTQLSGPIVTCGCIRPQVEAIVIIELRDANNRAAVLNSNISPFDITVTDSKGASVFTLGTVRSENDGSTIHFPITVNVTGSVTITVNDRPSGTALRPSPLLVTASPDAVLPTTTTTAPPTTTSTAADSGGDGPGDGTTSVAKETIVPGLDNLYLYIVIGGVALLLCICMLLIIVLIVRTNKRKAKKKERRLAKKKGKSGDKVPLTSAGSPPQSPRSNANGGTGSLFDKIDTGPDPLPPTIMQATEQQIAFDQQQIEMRQQEQSQSENIYMALSEGAGGSINIVGAGNMGAAPGVVAAGAAGGAEDMGTYSERPNQYSVMAMDPNAGAASGAPQAMVGAGAPEDVQIEWME
jgi:hypothetical protein